MGPDEFEDNLQYLNHVFGLNDEEDIDIELYDDLYD